MATDLVIRGRTVSVNTRILVLEAENRALRRGIQAGSESVHVFLRFMPFEVTLLKDLAAQFILDDKILEIESDNQLDGMVAKLFFAWRWTSDAMHQIFTDLRPDEVELDHEGNQSEAFEMVKSMLRVSKNGGFWDQRYQRTDIFVSDNPILAERCEEGTLDIENIDFYPHPDDERIWRVLAFMVLIDYKSVQSWPGFTENDIDDDDDYDDDDYDDVPKDAENDLMPHLDERVGESQCSTGEARTEKEIDAARAQSATSDPDSDNVTTSAVLPDRTSRYKANAENRVEAILKLENTWTVWQFYRMYSLLKSRPDNASSLEDFLRLPCFQEHWKVVEIADDDGDEDTQGFHRGIFTRNEFEGETLHELFDEFFDDDFADHVSLAYRRRKHEMSLRDPSFYLEYIPASELQSFTPSRIDSESQARIHDLYLLIGIDPLEMDESSAVSFVLWTPRVCDQECAVTGRYSPYFSEDLFSHEMSGRFQWPGLNASKHNRDIYEGVSKETEPGKGFMTSLLYRRMPIEDTLFCRELRHFWAQWNDVKLTRDEDRYYILEVLAAVKTRSLSKEIDRESAETFVESVFRSQQNSNDLEQESRMRQLLGPEYDLSYRYTLQYVDPGELSSSEEPSSPIGEGSFGRVYKCHWHSKPTIRGDIGATEPGLVALKTATERRSNLDGTTVMDAQFFKELRLAHSALLGQTSGITRFHGFTRVFSNPMDNTMSLKHNRHGSWKEGFALIFEFATEGTVLDFLRQRLRPSHVRENWLQISTALESIANGLSILHRRGVFHRDIHPNNILVEVETFSNTSEPAYSCTISDIGEGYIAAKADASEHKFTHTGCKFGLKEYQAPELAERGHSQMSDMYAFGQLGVDMIRYSSGMLLDAETTELRVPEKILHVLRACLDPNPEDRYEAVLVVKMFEQITFALQSDGEIGYVEGEDLSLELPTRQLSSWEAS